MTNTTIQIRTDMEVKTTADSIFNKLGITMSDGINIFLRQVNLHGGFPFEVKLAGIGTSAAASAQHKISRMQEYGKKTLENLDEQIESIKESILKFVQAKYIYLFGSHAYGNPTDKSDIDIYVVIPDDAGRELELYTEIMGDLSDKKIFFVDLIFGRESSFNSRKVTHMFERKIYQKGKLIYGQ